ncbi:MAG: 50S ribosomal protein L4, partial [Cyanobacteria bacterium HKST-UBA03]|nr:50S ribosomal protein L4 [Cyanobacteria bacterium HKST-UBA03]
LTPQGKTAGKASLPEDVFGVAPNVHLMYLAAKRELANGRSGSANTKTRAEVRGGGRKPWRQKGTGRARAGSTRSPLWKGGGVIFGPKPRSFAIDLPKKMRRLALRSALSVAVSEGKLKAIEDFKFISKPSTKDFAQFLKDAGLEGNRILILADTKQDANAHIVKASRNVPRKKVSLPLNLSVRDLIHADVVIATDDALNQIGEVFKPDTKSAKAPAKAAAAPAKKKAEAAAQPADNKEQADGE